MPMTEDFTVFFDAAEHGTSATLNGVPVVGIYEAPTEAMDGLLGRETRFTIAHSDAPDVARGQALVIASGPGAGTYRVRTPEPDGTGLVSLPLEKQ